MTSLVFLQVVVAENDNRWHENFSHSENFMILLSLILCEIIFWDCRGAKSAILTHLEAQNFDIYEILHFLRLNFTK